MLLLAGAGADVDTATSSQPAARAQKAAGRQQSAASGADCGICGGRCERAGLLSEEVFGESRVFGEQNRRRCRGRHSLIVSAVVVVVVVVGVVVVVVLLPYGPLWGWTGALWTQGP